eukprot:CAMPEP_0116902658 /NCGR_PEP_ID=MMETSP0467-20121206/10180_1 /TAXON_ID=283647 /ORGANISM="Mesodinium pulex, Strain SPMC105" /LENGTH=175 /DNA_ID=CAMNT_0004576605 /DNA_START=424 /DNA_END=950 /DNA_ORIENTATION=+
MGNLWPDLESCTKTAAVAVEPHGGVGGVTVQNLLESEAHVVLGGHNAILIQDLHGVVRIHDHRLAIALLHNDCVVVQNIHHVGPLLEVLLHVLILEFVAIQVESSLHPLLVDEFFDFLVFCVVLLTVVRLEVSNGVFVCVDLDGLPCDELMLEIVPALEVHEHDGPQTLRLRDFV